MKPTTLAQAGAFCALIAGVASAASAQPFDHQKCFKVVDPAPSTLYTADLNPRNTSVFPQQLGDHLVGGSLVRGCRIRTRALYLCTDVEKANARTVANGTPAPGGVSPGAEAGDRLCYKLSCPNLSDQTLAVKDQFGARSITVSRRTAWLCTPVVAATQCCERTGGSLAGACNDTIQPDANLTCAQSSTTAVLAPAGEFCDAATGTCGATQNLGDGCCECPRSSPPYPKPQQCFNMVTGSAVQNVCANGTGCFWHPGKTCSPTAQACE